MPPTTQSPWQRRFRRMVFLAGAASTVYLLSTYVVDRLKESRLRAIREKKQRETLKTHFTSLIAQISFTLYALLPTLEPQVSDAYPVEKTSQSIQSLSASATSMTSSVASVETTETPDNSLQLYGQVQEPQQDTQQTIAASPVTAGTDSSNGESWASEFQRRDSVGTDTESAVMVGSSLGVPETEDDLSSIASQPISLPPTDTSSKTPSPPSDFSLSSQLHPSPIKHSLASPSPPAAQRSKKELWGELKLQSISRSMTTAYLLPLLYLLTSSQLSVLARNVYLNDLKTSIDKESESTDLSPQDDDEGGFRTPRRNASEATLTGLSVESPAPKKRTGWFSSFSVESMGLSDFVEGSTSILPNPTNYFTERVTSYLPSFLVSTGINQTQRTGEINAQEAERLRMAEEEEAERLFLTYSWWLLNEGWKVVAARVDAAVEKVFGSLLLKKQLSLQDWESLLKEVRAEIEMDAVIGAEPILFDFVPILLPLSIPSNIYVPFPQHPHDHSPHLASLFNETLTHLKSPDGRFLLEKGVTTLTRSLLNSIEDEIYSYVNEEERRRLVECLPVINRWGKGVWESIPNKGVEELMALPEFEGFAALVFGDWARQT